MPRPVYVLHDDEVHELGSIPAMVFCNIVISAVHRAGPNGLNGVQQNEMRHKLGRALANNGMRYLHEVPEEARAYFMIHAAVMSHRLRNGIKKT